MDQSLKFWGYSASQCRQDSSSHRDYILMEETNNMEKKKKSKQEKMFWSQDNLV